MAARRATTARREGAGSELTVSHRIHGCYSEIDLDLKLLLKRGALVAVANWPVVAIQWAAQTTFKLLLSVPVVGAALALATLVGADQQNVLQGSTREIVASVSESLAAHPGALWAFLVAVAIVLAGGSVLLFLVKGGTVHVLLDAHAKAGAIEHEAITLGHMREAFAFTLERFVEGCGRVFRRYIVLGLVLMAVYGLSMAAYLTLGVVAYRSGGLAIALVALTSFLFILWITAVNLLYLLIQLAIAAEDLGVARAAQRVARFVAAEYRELGRVFFVVLGLLVAATLASALALSAVSLIAFVPVVGLVVVPVQLAVLLVQGLVFEYIGLVALGSYVTLYRRFAPATVAAEALEAQPAQQGQQGQQGSDWEGLPPASSRARSGG